MNNEEQILANLARSLEIQEESLALQRQAFENQQKAIADQQAALRYQLATGKIYRVSLVIFAVGITLLLYFMFHALHDFYTTVPTESGSVPAKRSLQGTP